RIEHSLIAHTVLEVGRGDLLFINCPEQIAYGVNKCVLVSDDVPRRPPRIDVRMFCICREYGFETAVGALFYVELELIQSLKIKSDASLAAVDLKSQMILMAEGKARGFDGADCSIFKFHQRDRRVV